MQERINICFFSGDITRSGGTERVSSIVANQLVISEKCNISFLSLSERKEETFFYLHKNIKRYTLYDEPVSGSKHILGYIGRIKKFIKEYSVDILIDIDGILDMYSIPALIGTKTKLISWEQFNFYQNPDGNYRKITRKLAAKWADAIVVLTQEDKGYYQKNLKIKNVIRHIYNPIVIEEVECSYNIDSKTIISAGRLTNQKGFDILIDVAKKVFEKHNDWKWIIAGEGEDRPKLEEKIKEYGLEEQLILLGNVNNIEDYYKQSSIYVLTSRFEGFGLVLTEAKSYKLPCVSFRCPAGPVEIIADNENGYLINCFNIEEMTDKICKLIEDKQLRLNFSNKALEDTKKFAVDIVAKQWEELFEELMNGK